MKKIFCFFIFLSLHHSLIAQNLFPVKLDNCVTDTFCLDCGDEKASFDPDSFSRMVGNLNKSNDYGKLSGSIILQILVDSTGHGCVLSHTDVGKHPITQGIINSLNEFTGWIPAKTKGKVQGKTSINVAAIIAKGVLTIDIQRVDMEAFKKSFDRPKNPEIFNKDYQYKNEHLSKYRIKVWDEKNSNLPNNFDDRLNIDKDNTVWLSVENGLVKFDGSKFTDAEQNLPENAKDFNCLAIATDNFNTQWIYGNSHIYSYLNGKWAIVDDKAAGFNGAYRIVNNPSTGEIYFCADEGLAILKDGNWSLINQSKVKELPSNHINFARRDSKNRIWIGTYSGSVLIDENGKATNLNNTEGVLKGKCITSMDEDENGNIFFSLYEYDRKDKRAVNNDEGIAIRYSNGEIKQFTTANSGMPFNHVTKVVYDRVEKVLWIATDRAGLVRYDLKDGWENYNNTNSKIPTSYISDMSFDSLGNLYLATRQGLVKIEKK